VTCDSRDAADQLVKRQPKLIVEVLSEGTASIDLSDKLDEYWTIPELEEYVLIDSRKMSVRVYRRLGDLLETLPATVAGSIELQSLGLSLTLSAIYEDVNVDRVDVLPTPPPAP
jgi:Uma2 family endonuclease